MVKVLVIGAGPCGLVSVKECLEQGLEVDCVDAQHFIGGVFGKDPGACYDDLYLTTSNVFMSFSDFPCSDKHMRYSKKEEYSDYLDDYVSHFNLMARIKLSTKVDSCVWSPKSKTWSVKITPNKGAQYEASYNAVIVCTGSNQIKKMPLTATLKNYTGQVLHSSDYQNAKAFAGKKVLVVGIGESAADISTEICEVAAATTAWSRREVMYAPRFPEANVSDPNHNEGTVLQGEQSEMKMVDFLEYHSTSRIGNSAMIWQYGLLRQIFWRLAGADKSNPQFQESCRACMECTTGKGTRVFLMADQAAWVTKNSRMCREVVLKKVKYICTPAITKAEGTMIEFSNGEKLDVDVVMCCTGYTPTNDWLKEDIGDRCPRGWFKHAIPACFEEKPIAFVGYARPHQGGIPQSGEIVVRLITLCLAGKMKLPHNFPELAKQEAKAENDYYLLAPDLKVLSDYPSFIESIARLIGCEPPVPYFNPVMFFKYIYYPMWPAWYRLRGPGANKKAAMEVFDKFPIRKYWSPTPISVLTTGNYLLAKLVTTIMFFVPFVPKTGVDRFGIWLWARPKLFVLHGNRMRFSDIFRP